MKEAIIDYMKNTSFKFDKFNSNETILLFINKYQDVWNYTVEDKIYINLINKTVICETDYEAMEIDSQILIILDKIFTLFNS